MPCNSHTTEIARSLAQTLPLQRCSNSHSLVAGYDNATPLAGTCEVCQPSIVDKRRRGRTVVQSSRRAVVA